MSEFYQTRMGRKFYGADFPRMVDALERIARALERLELHDQLHQTGETPNEP